MSYDLQIWSKGKADLSKSLKGPKWIRNEAGGYTHDNEEWAINIGKPDKVEIEDIPERISDISRDIDYLIDICLEPISATEEAKKLLFKTVKTIAKSVEGIIDDQQRDVMLVPPLYKEYIPAKYVKGERVSLIEMSWYMNINVNKVATLSNIIDYFESKLPDALPRRYGEYEPPQNKYIDKQNFLEFVSLSKSHLVWYTKSPVISVDYVLGEDAGILKHGNNFKYRCNMFSITLDANLINQSAWKHKLNNIFEDISLILKPFYGEARILNNYFKNGESDVESEVHPIRGPWWNGIPIEPGVAMVLDNTYIQYWDKYKELAKEKDGLYFVIAKDWADDAGIKNIIGKVPSDISQLVIPKWEKRNMGGYSINYNNQYPMIFPFDPDNKLPRFNITKKTSILSKLFSN